MTYTTRCIAVLLAGVLLAADWPQFRGPNCSGRAGDSAKLPAEIGPKTNVVWKVPVSPGHSSPVVVGGRVYLSAARDGKLVTLALDAQSGKLLWEAQATSDRLEKIHSIGNHAQATPAVDGERVYSFFGSTGLHCYDLAGNQLWHRPFGPFKNDFGAAASPILAGDQIILCLDHDQDSVIMALDKRNGATVWQTARPDILRNFCTPIVWESGGRKQAVVAGTLRVAGYDLETGKETWTAYGTSRTVCMTPVAGDDGFLYVSGWSAGGEPGEPIRVEPFDAVAGDLDKDKNGSLEDAELPEGAIKQRFSQVDQDKDGSITRKEYERFRELFDKGRNVTLAIRPGGVGDVTATHVVWKQTKHVPFCASPLYHDGVVYTIKDGGICSSLNAKTGSPLKQERLPATGNYYASPVVGDGKIYCLNENGQLSVISAVADWQVLAGADFEEKTYATPALAGGRIYLRTASQLYCFALPAAR